MSEFMHFEEDEAIKFIRKTLMPEKSDRISDDEILYIIDCIWDWYEKNGYLKINADISDEDELDIDRLVAYVRKEMRRARELEISEQDVEDVVKAELQYEESIENF